MKKTFFIFILIVIILSTSCASSSMSQSLSLENGETIKVSLDTTDGYKFFLDDDDRLIITLDNQEIARGVFFTDLDCELFIEDVEVLETNPENSPTFYLFQFEGDAGLVYGFLQQIDNSVTSVSIFSDSLSLEDTQNLVHRLQFEKIDS